MEDMVSCRYCGKNLEAYFQHAPAYCPYCGGAINFDTMKGKLSRESNLLTGRALWSTKASILGVVLGMLFLVGASTLFAVIVLLAIVLADPASFTDPFAILDLVETLFLSPTGVATLAIAQLVLVVPPLLLVKKYRRPLKERIQLLGWAPYTFRSREGGGWQRLGRDLGKAMVVAAALVGLQFALILLNDLAWGSFSPAGPGLPDMGAAITPSNIGELFLLIAVMMLLVGPTEEFLFRGFAQQGFEANMGERKGMVLTALLFTLAHVLPGVLPVAATLYLFFPYFGLSLALCGYYTRTKNLNQLVFIHGIYNSFLVTYAFLMASQATFTAGVVLAFTCLGIFVVLGVAVIARLVNQRVVTGRVQRDSP